MHFALNEIIKGYLRYNILNGKRNVNKVITGFSIEPLTQVVPSQCRCHMTWAVLGYLLVRKMFKLFFVDGHPVTISVKDG